MTEKTLTTENIKPALDALRGELAPWPVVAKKQDRLNTAQLNAANSGITSSLVAQIIANTAAIRALESAITGTGLRALVVSSLPAIGTQGILYIVPVTTYDPETDADVVNYSNEYIWIPVEGGTDSEGHYEQVGQTGIVINNGQLTITVNGTSVGTFTANQSGDTTAAITVPTNADYVDRTTDQTVAGNKTWTGEQSFTLPIVGSITGTASKAIADEDGTSIKTGYVNVAGNQTVTGDKSFTGSNTFNNILPNATNTYSLGSSSYQWSSVYARAYYYNGTEFSSKFVTTDTQQVITGFKIFNTGSWIRTPQTIDPTTDPSSFISGNGIAIWDNAEYWGSIEPHWTTDGIFRLVFGLSCFSTSETRPWSALSIDATKNNQALNLVPHHNNANLGTSTNQWKSVYSQTYYYNGTAWGLDKANVWTGVNTFSMATAESIAVKHVTYKGAILFRTNGVSNFKNYNTFLKWDINGYDNSLGLYRSIGVFGDTTTGATDEDIDTSFSWWKAHIRSKSLDFTNSVKATNDGTENSLKPITTNATDLGTSTNKWKTLNGINPGALSLPDVSKSVTVDIPVDWVTDGSAWNALNVSNMGDGWLSLTYRLCGASDYILARLGGTNANTYPSMLFPATLLGDSKYYIFAFLPVTKAMGNIRLEINLTSGSVVVNHSFYPCLGNV